MEEQPSNNFSELTAEQRETKADELKVEGNEFFKKLKYEDAIQKYSLAIECITKEHKMAAVFFSNRAMCHIKSENYG